MDSFTFDFSLLQQFSSKELTKWLTDNYTPIRKHIMARFKQIYNSNPKLVAEASRFPYLKEAHRAAMGMDFEEYRMQPFVHLFALFGLAQLNGSCHEVLFGEKKPVILRGQTLSVLDAFLAAPKALQIQLISQLYATPSNVDNPVYISYYRYADLAKEEGSHVNHWFMQFYASSELFAPLAAFQEDAMKPQEEICSFKRIPTGPSSLWWMALLVCPCMDISLDYLVREDYSSVAVRPDRELTELEWVFLSAYLSASREGQRNCRYVLGYNNLIQ